MAEQGMLVFKDVSFGFTAETWVLEGTSFSLPRGGALVIGGPSGTGKTTLLKLMNRLLMPSSGEIFFDGRAAADYPPPEYRRRVVYLQQTPKLMPGSVQDNLLWPFSFHATRQKPAPDAESMKKDLRDLGLGDVKLSGSAEALSTGQRQRICILRALNLKPDVLLLDEPVSALDRENRDSAARFIARKAMENEIALVLVTHARFHLESIPTRRFELNNKTLKQKP